MKLYKYLTLMILLGMASAANATSIDPGVILRGDGKSLQVGPAFGGEFQTPAGAPFECTSDGPQNNCFQNASSLTFVALHLFFDNPLLSYSCGDNSQDPFFARCDASDNEITFSGLGVVDSTNGCGEGGCQGIQNLDHFEIGIDTTDNTTYSAMADTIGSTPEPASALLFVIAMGAIALFFKRA